MKFPIYSWFRDRIVSQIHGKSIAISAWIIFSLIYIGVRQYQDFTFQTIQAGYRIGQGDTIKKIIDCGLRTDCQPFNLFLTEKQQVNLVNIECLRQKTDSNVNSSSSRQTPPILRVGSGSLPVRKTATGMVLPPIPEGTVY